MMIIARWHIDARFGHKQAVLDSLKRWRDEIGTQVGWTAEKTRIATGSVGAREATVELEVTLDSLAELNDSWDRLGAIEAHKQWSKDLEPYVVSGSPHWQVFRVVAPSGA